MIDMKKSILCLSLIILSVCISVLSSCSGRYQEKPFDGMKGRVQKVTVWHLMPELWYAGNKGTDVMYVNVSIYDVYGYEVCSALMDSAERIQSETESLFENGVCKRSTTKAGGRTLAQMNLVSEKRGTLEYSMEQNGRRFRMTVKQSSIGRHHKSVITEDGKVVTISTIRTDRLGNPVKVTEKEPQTGKKTVETNMYDENQNIIEKHITTWNEEGEKEENIVYTKYGDLDEHGNWKDARTYNQYGFPEEVLVREFEYWE